MSKFQWWQVGPYGMAEAFDDTRELSAQIDKDPAGWYGNIEGAILHGGVLASAFTRKTEQLFDTREWLHGRIVPDGSRTITTITAQAPGHRTKITRWVTYEGRQ